MRVEYGTSDPMRKVRSKLASSCEEMTRWLTAIKGDGLHQEPNPAAILILEFQSTEL
jgi:hypothetical protein